MSETEKMGHTPGPWEATDLAGKPVNDPSVMSAKHCIATVWINDISRKQAVANARLIAAAPTMAAEIARLREQNEKMAGLLEAALSVIPDEHDFDHTRYCDEIRDEINAALSSARPASAEGEGA